jgi:hypothetical protein
MGWMIPDAKLLLDQHRYPSRGPHFAAKPIVLGSFGQQVGQLGTLFLSQFRLGTGRWLVAQRTRTIFLGSAHPLTHRTFAHAEGLRDVFLFPALLIQLPGTQSATLAPVFGKGFFLTHTPFHRLAWFTPLGFHDEINRE